MATVLPATAARYAQQEDVLIALPEGATSGGGATASSGGVRATESGGSGGAQGRSQNQPKHGANTCLVILVT
jgi:hypothetical protein